MTTITVEQMRDKLVTVETLENMLSATEPLSTQDINSDTPVRFRLDPGWETSLEAMSDTAVANAFITVSGQERQLTKEAILQATSEVGIPQALVKRSPANLIEPFLNHYWGSELGSKGFKALSVNGTVSAFTKDTITPFSNIELVDRILTTVRNRYGQDTRIFADYKLNHSLIDTNVRLVIPDLQHDILDGMMLDVPHNEDDLWLGGIHLRNSLVGKKQTTIEPYLFRWWCTNGCTTERRAGMAWSRQGNGGQDLESVYAWAQEAVDGILGGMEAEFETIQALTRLGTSGNTADVLTEIFSRYELPVSQRDTIRENIETNSGRLTMYSIQQAITQAANDPEMSPERQDRLMRLGGAIPSTEFDPLKARVWREGHTAEPERPNPYEVQVITA